MLGMKLCPTYTLANEYTYTLKCTKETIRKPTTDKYLKIIYVFHKRTRSLVSGNL